MVKKFKILITIFLSILILFVLFAPKKICDKNDVIRIDRIVYNKQFGSGTSDYDRIEIENFNSDDVIDCISKYKSHLTLLRAIGYQLKDSEIEVFLTTNRKGIHIVLGNINYETSNYGELKRNIIDADDLKKELKQLLQLDDLKGERNYEDY